MLRKQGTRPPVFRSRSHLREVHDDLVRRRGPLSRWWSTTSFPPVPIALSPRELEFVRPLTDSATLAREGEEMHHCLGSVPVHHTLASVGAFHAFALTLPSRLTLAVRWSRPQQRWHLYDLRGPANAQADLAADRFAADLIARFDRAGAPPLLSSASPETIAHITAAEALGAPFVPFVPCVPDDCGDDLDGDNVVGFYDDGPF
jgi:hypothetical protein